METQKAFNKVLGLTGFIFVVTLLLPQLSLADQVTAEYKCTSKCQLCINYPKKTVCSDKYSEDGDEFLKAKKLSKFVNDGLVIPDDKLKPGFDLNTFAAKYFNCELMIKKAKQIAEATQNMCVAKTVSYKKTTLVPRSPASVETKKTNKGSAED
jgi:hypothetical protein